MQDMQPDNMNPDAHNAAAEAAHDREGAMARADLYKLANYSLKLFKKMQDDDQLEGWVQAKITKAADYIASVYHYLEYEMEFSEYGAKLDSSEMYSEDQKVALKNRLMEAKTKVAQLKKLQAEKVKEAFDDKAKVGDTYKSSKGGTVTKTATGLKHEKGDYSDEEHVDAQKKPSKAGLTGAERQKQKAADKEQNKASKDYEKKNPGSVKRYEAGKLVKEALKGGQKKLDVDNDGDIEADDLADLRANKKVKEGMGKSCNESAKGKMCPVHGMKECGTMAEGKKPDFLDMDKDGNKKEPMKKAVADKKKNPFAKKDSKVDEGSTCNETHKGESCPVHGMKECPMEEAAKPSAGMTKKEKSSTVKDAKAGKDIGKPGKSFDKVAKKAGGGEKGEKIAAAAMWKNKAKSLKENLDAMLGRNTVEEAAMDQMDSSLIALIEKAKQTDPAGLEAAMQQGPEALSTFLKSTLSDIDSASNSNTPSDMSQSGMDMMPQGGSDQMAQEPLAESTRMREQIARLNRNEQLQVNESSEVAQIRRLAKLLG